MILVVLVVQVVVVVVVVVVSNYHNYLSALGWTWSQNLERNWEREDSEDRINSLTSQVITVTKHISPVFTKYFWSQIFYYSA